MKLNTKLMMMNTENNKLTMTSNDDNDAMEEKITLGKVNKRNTQS